MYEWVSGNGTFSAALLTSIIIGLSWLVGWCLRTLIAPAGPPTTPTEIARSWAGWAVFMSSFSSLPKFFDTFDIFPLAMWLLGAIPVAILAFAFGWGYGRWYKFSNQTRPMPSVALLVADDSIGAPGAESTWMHREGLDFCEAFIGKSGLRYYLSKFEHFGQIEPKPTPTLNVFPVYKYTIKYFKPNWNWSAFLFSYGWALYRNLHGWAIACFLVSIVCFMAIKEGATGLGFISLLGAYIAFGMYANALYYSKAKRLILAARQANGSETQARLQVSDKGGIDPHARWVAAAHVLVGIPAIITVLFAPAQQLPTADSLPNQALAPIASEVVEAPVTPILEAPKLDLARVDDPYKTMEALYRNQQYRELAAAAYAHLSGNPNDVTALNYGGLALSAQGNMNGARSLFRNATALAPEDPALYYNLASTYDSTEYKKIIEFLEIAQKLDPNNKLTNDSLASWQQYAQQMDFARRAQTEYRKPSSSTGRDDDGAECRVKPVMTDAELRRWRLCSQKLP